MFTLAKIIITSMLVTICIFITAKYPPNCKIRKTAKKYMGQKTRKLQFSDTDCRTLAEFR